MHQNIIKNVQKKLYAFNYAIELFFLFEINSKNMFTF